MGVLEELPDDCGSCPQCGKIAHTKCTGCKQVYYCSRDCQKKNWKLHKPICKLLPYKICNTPELGNFLIASREIKKDEVIVKEGPLVIGPSCVTPPICLACYNPVDGSYKCPKSGWPLCGPICAKKAANYPEVVVPAQCDATFEIDSYTEPCYLYESILTLKALLLQKSAPNKFKQLMQMESHMDKRKGTPIVEKVKERIIDVMKKTLGIMVFEAICPEYDFSDETIQKIQGILDTNKKEIRLAFSDVEGLYATGCLLEHSCKPNVKITFDKQFNITVRAGRDIAEGEHLATMYTHAFWGTVARRDHLNLSKNFWCTCPRCSDPTEFGTNFSTILDDGHPMLPKDPLNSESDWICEKTGMTKSANDVKVMLANIGTELETVSHGGTPDDIEQFLESKKSQLHPNHYHMVTAKHTLLQMYGRCDGFLIQDMTVEQLKRKEELCRENLELLYKLDPHMIRLEIYAAAAHFELHLPLIQLAKREWESGKITTDDFKEMLKEPKDQVQSAIDLLKMESNENLPEGQLLLQAKDTMAQLEGFMKTLGCQM